MQLPTNILANIKTALQAWLKQDSQALPRFNNLQAKLICLHISGLDLKFYFIPDTNEIAVIGNCKDDPDATIKVSAMLLMRLNAKKDIKKLLLGGDIATQGDRQLATLFSRILSELDINWEQLLSTLVGDLITDQSKQITAKTKKIKTETVAKEQKEQQTLAVGTEVNLYLDQVDELRMSVDRLEKRINRYIQQVGENKNQ